MWRQFQVLRICFLFLPVELILVIIGVATPILIHGEKSGAKIYLGLWAVCATETVSGVEASSCLEYKKVPGWLEAVRGFGVLAIIISIIAFIFSVLKICMKDRVSVLIAAIILSFINAVNSNIIVSVAVFAENYDKLVTDSSIFHFGFSFDLCAVSIVFSAFAGVSMIIEIAKRSSYTTIDGR